VPSSRTLFVDLDDVLSETTVTLLELLEERTGRRLVLEEVETFELGSAFGLAPAEWEAFMVAAHQDEVLSRMRPRRGAAEVLERWSDGGWRIEVMTGRPPSTEEVSREWLVRHELVHHHLEFVDKYGRPDWRGGARRATPLAEISRREFAAAVEDSPETARFLAEELGLLVALLDRPWNRRVPGDAARGRIVRCRDWVEVEALLADLD